MEKNLNTNPTVSVVMPVYNGEPYLREAIQSILDQTFKDFELIIINDGSNDRSEQIILGFNDHRIRYLKNEINLGLIKTLNIGIGSCNGHYIARMDADDISMKNRLEEQVSAFKSNPESVIIGSEYYLLRGRLATYVKNLNNSDYLKSVLLFSTCFCHPSVMLKNIFKEQGFSYNENYVHAEDYQLWTQLSFKGKFHIINKALLKYRSHQSQISSTHHDKQLAINSKIRRDYYSLLKLTFTERQLDVLDVIGNNTKIKSRELLLEIEECLLSLKKQNDLSLHFDPSSFSIFLTKFWVDSCGNTSIGLMAYRTFLRSSLAKRSNLWTHTRLLGKCILRMRLN